MKQSLLILVVACGRPYPVTVDADADADAPVIDAPPIVDASVGPPMMLDVQGAVAPVHDPSIISVDGIYYVFSTGTGLPIRTSIDLKNWSLDGAVFATAPPWITTTDPNNRNDLWAPDISHFGGEYHLYYAASTFGSNVSCIGHATASSPANNSWLDQGPVICSAATDDFNAIDPNAFVDGDGSVWLAFGSFWSGLKLIQLDPTTGARLGTEIVALATRPNTAVEAPYVVFHDQFYYLFESVDFCCNGVDSDYKMFVGRATDVRGPYVDKTGAALLSGAGTSLVEGDVRWRGPGHDAILRTAGGDYNIYHALDANAAGIPTLRIAELQWSSVDGWPISAGP